MRGHGSVVIAILVVLCSQALESAAETYVAAQIGAGFPEPLTGVNVGGPGVDRRTSLDLDIGLLYGAKLGHHFEATRWKWLGVEMEVFRTTINMPQQPRRSVQVGRPDITPVNDIAPGATVGLTVAAFNFTFRLPFDVPEDVGSHWYPYAGFGPAIFVANAKSTSPDSSFGESQTTTIGINAQAGVRYMVNQDWGLFFEYKWNQARFSFAGTGQGPINGSFVEHDLVFGLSYHLPP